jgi:hypothetical protein
VGYVGKMPSLARRLRAALLLVLSLWTGACFAYQDIGRLPDAGELPSDLRIYRYDGTVVDLAESRIESDVIRGFRPRSSTPVLIPLAQVDSLKARRMERTPSLVVGGVVLAVLAVLFASHVQSLGGPTTTVP